MGRVSCGGNAWNFVVVIYFFVWCGGHHVVDSCGGDNFLCGGHLVVEMCGLGGFSDWFFVLSALCLSSFRYYCFHSKALLRAASHTRAKLVTRDIGGSVIMASRVSIFHAFFLFWTRWLDRICVGSMPRQFCDWMSRAFDWFVHFFGLAVQEGQSVQKGQPVALEQFLILKSHYISKISKESILQWIWQW